MHRHTCEENVNSQLEKRDKLKYVCFKVKAITLIQSLLICGSSTDEFHPVFTGEGGSCWGVMSIFFHKDNLKKSYQASVWIDLKTSVKKKRKKSCLHKFKHSNQL